MAVTARPAIDVGDPNCQLDWEWTSKTVTALDARIAPLETRAASVGYIDMGIFAGPWLTGSGAATVSTAGHLAFSAPTAGTYVCTMHASAFVTVAGQDCFLDVYLDGSLIDSMRVFYNQASVHMPFIPAVFPMTLTAGAHTVGYVLRTSGVGGVASLSSNIGDYGTGIAWRVS